MRLRPWTPRQFTLHFALLYLIVNTLAPPPPHFEKRSQGLSNM